MAKLDQKQQRIIRAWLDRSREVEHDAYGAFIGLWIAFNAYCVGLYSKIAHRNRADLRQDKGLRLVTDVPARTEALLVREPDRLKLEITHPGRILIIVRERYTEDIIFAQFSKEYQAAYGGWLADSPFRADVERFHRALEKNGRFYVINMALAGAYEPDKYEAMTSRGVIVPFNKLDSLGDLIAVLY
jgi:hypothetical protein